MVRKIITACIGASLLTLGLSVPAGAHDGYHADDPWQVRDWDSDADGWVSAAESSVQGSFAVELSKPAGDTGTSIETNDLGLEVSSGDTLTVDVEMSEATNADTGAVRMFVYDHADADTATEGPTKTVLIEDELGGSSGTATLTVPFDGTIGTMGLTYDASNTTSGEVGFSDLRLISGEEEQTKISFRPAPEVEPEEPTLTHPVCEDPGTFTIPDVDGVIYWGGDEDEFVFEPGVHDAEHGEIIKVVATAAEGYELAEDRIYEWVLRPVAKGCPGEDGEDGADGEDGEVVVKLPTRVDTGR